MEMTSETAEDIHVEYFRENVLKVCMATTGLWAKLRQNNKGVVTNLGGQSLKETWNKIEVDKSEESSGRFMEI